MPGITDPNQPLTMAQLAAQQMAMAGDAGGENTELMRQMAQSKALRGEQPTTRMDWASQAARAMQGVGKGKQFLNEYDQSQRALTANKDMTDRLMKLYGGGDPAMAQNADIMQGFGGVQQ